MGIIEKIGDLVVRSTPPAEIVLPESRPLTIDDVITRMRTIDSQLPESDGVAQFNRMYWAVTEEVLQATRNHAFEDREFAERLDIVFADLYLSALDSHIAGGSDCPHAWIPLFEARSNRRIAPIQFALAGMNAHINRDLAVAVVETCRELGREVESGTPHHRDFEFVNSLLAVAQERVEPWFKRGLLGWFDRILGNVDEVLQMWSIERARQNAWIQAEALWALRGSPSLAQRFVTTLDRTVGFAGRGLLVPQIF